MSINIDVKTVKSGFWHLPKTFYALLFIEFWERFAFYGLQAVAVIYFVQKFNLTESNSSAIFSSFSALLYALMIVGGIIGDKVLGLSRTYLLGILFFIVGYSLLSIATTESVLYLAMGFILVGNVLFKTNATNYVSRCFENNDPRLDSAYTYFYMSINIGSFSSMIIVPIISKTFSYEIGLSFCAWGMICAFFFYLLFRKRLALSDNQVGKNQHNKWIWMIIISILGLVGITKISKSRILLITTTLILKIIILIIWLSFT